MCEYRMEGGGAQYITSIGRTGGGGGGGKCVSIEERGAQYISSISTQHKRWRFSQGTCGTLEGVAVYSGWQ